MEKAAGMNQEKKRKTRVDKGHPQITRRDEDVLLQIGMQTAYRFDQLQSVLAWHPDSQSTDPTCLSESRTREIVERWKTLGLVMYQKIRYDEPGWVSLTRKGLYHFNLSLRFIDPRYSDLDHLFWVNEVRAYIEETYGSRPGFQWESERQYRTIRERFKAQLKQELDLWIPYEYQGSHRPDALLRYRRSEELDASTVVSAIEVELSEKDYSTWRRIFLELSSFYTNAHYYVDATVKWSLIHALEKFQNEEPMFGELSTEHRQYIYIHDLEEHLYDRESRL